MDRKNRQLLLLIVSCSVTGIILGGTASWADSNQCLKAKNVTSECLTQDPFAKTVQGMSTGFIAGAGAAIGAVLQLRKTL